jgi:hypothetical protein
VTSISAHHAALSLTSLELDDSYEAATMHDRSVYEALLSLFSYRALQLATSRVSAVCARLNDSWLEGAAIAWPMLGLLSLGNLLSPLTILTGLLRLVKHCPPPKYSLPKS